VDIITSRHNTLVKHIVALHDQAHRTTHKQFIAEGIRTCTTLLESGMTMHNLFYTAQNQKHVPQFAPTECVGVSDEIMQKISVTTTPSGILGVFAIPPEPALDTLTPGLVLAQIANPGNMGTLIRTAAAMGIRSVVIVEGCDPWNPKVVHATSGTIGKVQIFDITWDTLLQVKKEIPLSALAVEGGIMPHRDLIAHNLLVVGSEAHGLPDEWLRDCSTHITLPMPGGTESLNAAVAGSIALYIGHIHEKG
jgi:RNA methyltransferase, TrmH family